MEIWAFCQECDRWFYCAGWREGAVPQPTCPVCGAAPQTFVDRAATASDVAEGAG